MLVEVALRQEHVAEVVDTMVDGRRFERFLAPVNEVPLQTVCRHTMAGIEGALHVGLRRARDVCIGSHQLLNSQSTQ